MRASNNNRADTVLQVFRGAVGVWGMPSRLRGDHGTENISVAAYIIYYRGPGRASYMWGRSVNILLLDPALLRFYRSVHNTRIERLWVDLKFQLIHKWVNFFSSLELSHGLIITNQNHKWLLQYLFLGPINEEIERFVHTWNRHSIRRDGQRTRSPLDMWEWDIQIKGVPGLSIQGEFAILLTASFAILKFYRS